MNHQQMTGEMIEFDSSLPESTFSTINTIWDKSAKIFALVIDNANLVPDDRGNKIGKEIPAYKKEYNKTPSLKNKAKTPLTKFALACLQEEHALWLK
jgi:hypothetical protein